jgi:hypothetical protein
MTSSVLQSAHSMPGIKDLWLHCVPSWPSPCGPDHLVQSLKAKTTIAATPAPRLTSWDRATYLRQRAVHSSDVERNGSSSSSLRRPNAKSRVRLRPLTSESSKIKLTSGTRLRKGKRPTQQLMLLCKSVPAAFMCDPYQLTSRSANEVNCSRTPDSENPPRLTGVYEVA